MRQKRIWCCGILVEHMKKPWLRNPLASSGLNQELPFRQVPPTTQRNMEENDLHAGVKPQKRHACSVVPRTNCTKNAWENWSFAAIAPARHDHQRQRSKRNCSAPHVACELCASSCATFACAEIQTTNGRARGIPSSLRVALDVKNERRRSSVPLRGASSVCGVCVCVLKVRLFVISVVLCRALLWL